MRADESATAYVLRHGAPVGFHGVEYVETPSRIAVVDGDGDRACVACLG